MRHTCVIHGTYMCHTTEVIEDHNVSEVSTEVTDDHNVSEVNDLTESRNICVIQRQ